jgi:putative tricarboxylic transport membrane protein
LLLAGAGFLLHVAANFEVRLPPGRLGPDFWPKLILGLLLLSSAYAIVRAWLPQAVNESGREPDAPVGSLDTPEQGMTASHTVLLGWGIALAIAYAALVDKLGFLICTVLFLACFAYVGLYRRHWVIWLTSILGSIALMFLFMRVVYISLPIGVPPFSAVSLTAMKLMGIS